MTIAKKVMIVEDDPLLSIVEEKLVTKLGYQVVGKARTGEDTLTKISELKPEILIIDVQLAGTLNGIQTVQKLRDRHIHIPVIFLSGDNTTSVMNSAEDVNYIDFLLKPVSMNELSVPLQKASSQLISAQQSVA